MKKEAVKRNMPYEKYKKYELKSDEEEMKTLFSYLPPLVRKVFVSATQQTPVPAFAAVKQLQLVSGNESKEALPVQMFLVNATSKDKIDTLFMLLCPFKKRASHCVL